MLTSLETICHQETCPDLNGSGLLSIGKVCAQANDIAGHVLDLLYDGKREFPVNIRGIVRSLDIGVYETNLNVDRGFRVEKVNGYLRWKLNGGYDINLQHSDSEFTKRYVLAHELSRYLLGRMSGDNEMKGCRNFADPLFAKEKDETSADILAAFLLFPPECVLESLKEYTEQMRRFSEYPIDSFEWIRDLAQSAQISFYFTLISYQYLKIYLSFLYNTEPENELVKKYREFFK